MVGLVIVAHSRRLAEGLAELVRQVVSADLRLVVAAGVGAERGELGTDASAVAGAIQSVYSPDGVLVLMDLGSAVLSADMALEFLPEEMRPNVLLCAAPLVEGAIAAGVQASLGNDLQTVCREAQKALSPKIEQIGAGQPAAEQDSVPAREQPQEIPASRVTLRLGNPHGLHARPAACFVQVAASFDAEVWVTDETNGKGPASARSLNSLVVLGAVGGHQITISASGLQAVEAVQALSRLVSNNFGEAIQPATDLAEDARDKFKAGEIPGEPLRGIAVSEGIALGPVAIYQPAPPHIDDYQSEDPRAEWERLQAAIDKTRRALQERRSKIRVRGDEGGASIFEAHLLILQDPDLLQRVREPIFTKRQNAAAAWQAGVSEVAKGYALLEDPYQRARGRDVTDVGNQVLFALSERLPAGPIRLPGPAIIFARELTPGEVAQLDPELVLGVVTSSGERTSHSAILIRSLGLPAISGIDFTGLRIEAGTQVGLDGSQGLLWVEPASAVQSELVGRRQAWVDERERLIQGSQAPVLLRSGRRIEVAANAGSLLDARAARLNGADGIGVLRTEFLYLNRSSPPGEEEQLATLLDICRVIEGQPVIVRTLDVGGDKSLSYLPMPAEANPFLGRRAIRLSFRYPDLFLTQLRAVLRAAAQYPVRLMYPMIAALDEIEQAQVYLDQAHQALEKEQVPHGWPLETGIMVETPSAALLSSKLAPYVDFFSIGTNDLTQYTLAAERGNTDLAGYLDAVHPAVLRLIKTVTEGAAPYGKWVGVCGEVAGDPAAVPILVGLGVDELSMNPPEIPRVKSQLRSIGLKKAVKLAEQALDCTSAQEVRKLVERFESG